MFYNGEDKNEKVQDAVAILLNDENYIEDVNYVDSKNNVYT